MNAVELEINDDHPLALELTSLRVAVARFQHEAHASALKLQRHSLDSTLALERAQVLERENAALRQELTALHAHPEITPHPATLQVQELTVALRRVSDKLGLSEDTLLARTTELAGALADVARAKHEVEGAYALAAGARAREEEGKVRERELLRRVRAAEEERRMTDRAVQEYADLVRNLERRQSIASSPPNSAGIPNGKHRSSSSMSLSVDGLADSRSRLQKLLEEFAGETEKLEAEIGRLHSDLAASETKREAERKAAEQDLVLLASTRAELDRLRNDDGAAAKMVSRYMKFSQSTTDALQRALDNVKTRHAASTSTLHHRLSNLESSLASERRQAERLRNVLDEITEQLARESYGRRREVSLRLAVVGREDGLAEALRRWVRRARETLERPYEDQTLLHEAFDNVVEDAVQLLGMVDGDDEASGHVEDPAEHRGMGSIARILAAQDAVKTLVEELQVETEKRMEAERILGRASVEEDGTVVPPPAPAPASPAADKGLTADVDTRPSSMIDAATSPILPPSPGPLDPPVHHPPTAGIATSVSQQTEAVELPLVVHIPVPKLPTIDELHQPSPRFPPQSPVFISPQAPIVGEGTIAFPSSSPPTSPDRPTSISLDVTGEASSSSPPPESPTSPSLLSELAKVKSRYDTLQRAFRDCHLALRDLKQTLATTQSSSVSSSVLQTALSRLDDFNEDARVELEIRVADEERISRGYVTLLSVPGAISSQSEAADVERAVNAFVDGTDSGVSRALTQFQRKLDDLEHDIAAVKLAVHSSPEIAEDRPSTPPPDNAGSSWTSLAAGFFTPSRPASPAPTFGSVMTTPRLRRAPSFTTRARAPSIEVPPPNPFAALDLRIPMPEHTVALSPNSSRPSAPRARTTSGMYMLGLGMRSSSFVGSAATMREPKRMASSSPLHQPAGHPSRASGKKSDEDEDAEVDSDVE
ncbi:hypothetical protein FA95DRAFT_1603157 [Auriscalpium vulgare]|uniref:Uncharacterized protein n=1 Tax=Auriscalpium vulgare TaxID=40419 RepID=A0ACB8S3N3_9AGAM|nr:hypothetical protein FA95DRAFT_1603157 [Auriscalpium vulgare]